MIEFLRTLPPVSLIAIIIALAFVFKLAGGAISWVFNEYWSNRKALSDKHDLALYNNTMAIVKLQVQLESLTEILKIVPKLKADLDVAHEKIRGLEHPR